MDLAVVDRSATSGKSPLHTASPAAKLIAFALVIAAVVTSTQPVVTLGVGMVLAAVVIAWRLPGRSITAFASYPALFALIFALAASNALSTTVGIVLKAITAALAAVLLVFTTPYPQVFAPLQRFLPALVADALLITYRSFFLLLERFDNAMTAGKLRAGLGRREPIRAVRIITSSLAGTLLYSLDLSQRTYDVMRLRGYDRRLRVSREASGSRALDAGVVLVGAVVLALALAGRFVPAALAQATGATPVILASVLAAPVAGLAAILLALVIRRSSR